MTGKPKPKCVDCSETKRGKFYAHPTNKSGVQRRCKSCDNTKRMTNQRLARAEPLHVITLVESVDGVALFINGRRIAAPKGWEKLGYTKTLHRFDVEGHIVRAALKVERSASKERVIR